ncbi:MAG: M48 family metallopeptidase [candidate division NC10 bacterium]|nr:M48 family metallopeptidase [candidate division NC10 bacterium]
MRCAQCGLVQRDAPTCKACGAPRVLSPAQVPLAAAPGPRTPQPATRLPTEGADLFQQQARNRRRTAVIIGVFIAFVVLLGIGFDLAMGSLLPVPAGGTVLLLPIGGLAALALSSGSAYFSLRHGDRAVLGSTRAMPLESFGAPDPKGRQYHNVVEEMAIAAGLPVPRTYVVPDPDPNAFATGRDPEHASIAVTAGLLALLNREELQGVVAHEMAHIRNYDTRTMTVMAALLGAILLLHDWSGRLARIGPVRAGGRRGRRAAAPFLLLWFLLVLLAPILGRLLAMAVSRTREFQADATAAELTRNPLGLAGALRKLEEASEPTRSIHRGVAHLCIVDPLGLKVGLREGFWADLFATHPPLATRIARLEAMAYQAGARS